jgi:hypothetical protein
MASGGWNLETSSPRGNAIAAGWLPFGLNKEYQAVEKNKKSKEQNVKSGQQETKEPWKKPEKSDHHPTKDSPNPRPRRHEDNETT